MVTIWVYPLERKLISTGLKIELPVGYEAQIRSRSGLALKNGISVLNSPGTIDSDYRGDIGIILINFSNEKFKINNGDRIAQIIIAKHESPIFIDSSELSESKRGKGGFGSTEKNNKVKLDMKFTFWFMYCFFLVWSLRSKSSKNTSYLMIDYFQNISFKQQEKK